MTLPDLLILALATWRFAYMLVKEDGPGQCFTRLRKRVGVFEMDKQDPTKGMVTERLARNGIAEMFLCVNCMSVWTAALCLVVINTPLYPLVYVLAISGLALMAHSYTGWRFEQ